MTFHLYITLNMTPLYTEETLLMATSQEMLPVQCEYCTGSIYVRKHYVLSMTKANSLGAKEGRFCSQKCNVQSRSAPHFVGCLQCQRTFKKHPSQAKRSTNHFCGSSCAAKYHNAHKTSGTRVSKLEL